MRKLLAILLTGVVFFMMSGCTENEIKEFVRDTGDTLSFHNLVDGYAVAMHDGSGAVTIDFCGNNVIIGTVAGTFSFSGNTVIVELPSRELVILIEEPNGHSYFTLNSSVSYSDYYGHERSMIIDSFAKIECHEGHYQ